MKFIKRFFEWVGEYWLLLAMVGAIFLFGSAVVWRSIYGFPAEIAYYPCGDITFCAGVEKPIENTSIQIVVPCSTCKPSKITFSK